jgi:hypothetical protein
MAWGAMQGRSPRLAVGTLVLYWTAVAAAQQPGWSSVQLAPPHEEFGTAAFGGPVQILGIEEGWGAPETADWWSDAPAAAQGHALPTQYPLDDEPYADVERYFPPPSSSPPTPWSEPLPSPQEAALSWVTIKQVAGEATWVLGGDQSDSLGIATFEARAKFEFPRAPMLTIAPRAGWHLLSGPQITDLPSQLYDASLETIVSLPVGKKVFVQGAISPSIFTDGDNTTSDALRFPGRLLVFVNWTERLTLSSGVVYLDRENVSFLPSAGLIYRPSDDVKFELLIPRPRIAWRYWTDGTDGRWVYVVGELGGGSWAIRRASGLNDVATYTDYRLMLGWEHTSPDGLGLRLEGGYVFGRELEYVSNLGNTDLPGTGVVRIALTY